MSKELYQPTEGNTGFLTCVLLNDLLAEIRGLRRDLKAQKDPPAKLKAKKK